MSLAGLRVLVTRPAHQADKLCAAIEAAGGHALRQPLLDIAAPTDIDAARDGLRWAERAQDVIFTSANAVRGAWRLVPGWQPRGDAAAVGRATARALREKITTPVRVPAGDYSAAGLLALPAYAAPRGRDMAIVTGEGGRRLLVDTLTERGAQVRRVAVYRRVGVAVAPARLDALLARSDVLVVTSGEALRHLVALTPAAQRPCLLARKLVVPSTRVLEIALQIGFTSEPLRPARMDDAAIVAVLARWVAAQRSPGE